jgi:hypothetical protein
MRSLNVRFFALLPLLLVVACSSTNPTTGSSSSSQSVLERNKNPSRDGHFVQSALTKTAAATMTATAGFTANFTGTMYASPLYLQNGPGGKGVFFAVTTGNDVYALDETTGAVVWMHNIGSSPADSGAGCGGIHPIGIESTPVIDAASRTAGRSTCRRCRLRVARRSCRNPRTSAARCRSSAGRSTSRTAATSATAGRTTAGSSASTPRTRR